MRLIFAAAFQFICLGLVHSSRLLPNYQVQQAIENNVLSKLNDIRAEYQAEPLKLVARDANARLKDNLDNVGLSGARLTSPNQEFLIWKVSLAAWGGYKPSFDLFSTQTDMKAVKYWVEDTASSAVRFWTRGVINKIKLKYLI